MSLQQGKETGAVMRNLADNIPDYLNCRSQLASVCEYLAQKLNALRPDEASAARILNGLIRNEKVGGY